MVSDLSHPVLLMFDLFEALILVPLHLNDGSIKISICILKSLVLLLKSVDLVRTGSKTLKAWIRGQRVRHVDVTVFVDDQQR